jgi:DNA-binding NarL/FixJ family response regulator
MLAEQMSMNTAITNTVLLIQPSELQQLIWQRILESQDIEVIVGSEQIDPAAMLTNIEEIDSSLPKLLLIDQQLRDWNWEPFCQWCQQTYPEIKIILLSRSSDLLTPLQRQAALQAGVVEVLPAFEIETIALSVITALKAVLGVFQQDQQNDSLATSIVNIKRDLNQRDDQQSPKANPKPKTQQVPQETLPREETTEQPVYPPPQQQIGKKKRVYRGRIY